LRSWVGAKSQSPVWTGGTWLTPWRGSLLPRHGTAFQPLRFHTRPASGAPHHDACSPVHPRFPSVRRGEGR
jgi:hypothetical protein